MEPGRLLSGNGGLGWGFIRRFLNLDNSLILWDEAVRQAVEGLRPSDSGDDNRDVEQVPLTKAVGRTLAQAVCLDRDEPPAARSAMDGFAVRAEDADENRRLVGAVHAGTASFPEVGLGETSKIMTGGTVPPGANAVIPVERTSVEGDIVSFSIVPEVGAHIRNAGEMGKAGREVLEKGIRIGLGDVGVAAGCGADPLLVRTRPKVAIISTGDEIVEWTKVPEDHQVRDSNRLVVAAQAEAAGAEIVMSERIPDQVEALQEGVDAALREADLVVTLGGVSMGEKDHLPGVFEALAVEKKFHGVHVQPGKPLWCGSRDGVRVLGLPGNPVSAFVVFEVFGVPIVESLLGLKTSSSCRLETGVLEGTARSKGRPLFLPASVALGDQRMPLVSPCSWTGSGDWTALAGATALLYLPEETSVESGSPVEFLRLA